MSELHLDEENREVHQEVAGPKEWLGLSVLSLTTLLLALDFSVLHLALPHVVADLHPEGTQQLWILDIYGFMIAGFLVTMGSLGDRIGRRKILMFGSVAFGLCSVAAAFSVSAEMLVITRGLLGVAGATLMPSTLSLISNMFKHPGQRGTAIAVWLSCFSAGGAVGPFIGGLMLEKFWWGSVFLLGVPVMILLVLTAPFLLPEFRDPDARTFDLPSVAISLCCVLSTVYGLKEIANHGLGVEPVLSIVIGLGAGYLFIRRQKKVKDPLVDLQFFRNRTFNGALIGLFITVIALGGFVLFFAQYLQLAAGLSPLHAGLLMIPYAVANIIGAMLTPYLASKMRISSLIAGGLTLSIIGFLSLNLIHWLSLPGVLTMVTGSIVIMLGLSPLMVLSTDLVVSSVPPEKTGAASSLSEMSSELGMALGITTFGMIGTAVYRYLVAGHISPEMLQEGNEAAEAVSDTLASAVAAVDSMSDLSLLSYARDAFLTSFQVVGGISSMLLFGLVVLFMTVLKDVGQNRQ